MGNEPTLADLAVDVLTTANPSAKADRTFAYAEMWREGFLPVGHCKPPDQPARPAQPELCAPRDMAKRSTGPKGRIALVHALAHIELNAIDLAWDIIARFTGEDLPPAFYDDWVEVADEEARHYVMLEQRLATLNAAYGNLPAHAGLWEAASKTAHSLPARLALIPMTLEARGIDTTPQTSKRLREADDTETADLLDVIYEDEIGHLAVGVRWFEFLCNRHSRDPFHEYKHLLDEYFRGSPKGPFNLAAREQAGMGPSYLAPWM